MQVQGPTSSQHPVCTQAAGLRHGCGQRAGKRSGGLFPAWGGGPCWASQPLYCPQNLQPQPKNGGRKDVPHPEAQTVFTSRAKENLARCYR